MLETIDNEGFDGDTPEHLIVEDRDRLNCWQTLDLGQQDKWVQVVVRQHKFLKLRELFKFVQILMVDDQVEPHIVQMNFLNLRVKLRPLEYFKRIAIDVEYFVRLYLSVAALYDRFFTLVDQPFALFLLV